MELLSLDEIKLHVRLDSDAEDEIEDAYIEHEV